MRVLDLFSGIGGFSLAARWAGMETVAFCEIDPFCQKVLKKNFPGVKIYDDIRTLTKEKLEKDGVIDDSQTIDLVCGGIPCQPFSLAGKQRGQEDDRYLWPEMFRLIQELRPAWVVGENVVGIVRLALDDIIADLESEGYTVRTFVLPASAVGAPHRRDRVWIVAHADSPGLQGRPESGDTGPDRKRNHQYVERRGELRRGTDRRHQSRVDRDDDGVPAGLDRHRWPALMGKPQHPWEPSRVATGIKHRKDRLKALGNTIVPQVAYQILRRIMEVEKSYAAQRI